VILELMAASLAAHGCRRSLAERLEQQLGQRLDQSLRVRGRQKRRRAPRFESQCELSSILFPSLGHTPQSSAVLARLLPSIIARAWSSQRLAGRCAGSSTPWLSAAAGWPGSMSANC
jgi:hypothetical protein